MAPNNEIHSKQMLMKKVTGGTGILPDGYFDNSQGDAVEQVTATGFDFEPLESGDVMIEFFADDGKTINTQVITREALARLPVVVRAFYIAMEEGEDVAQAFLKFQAENDTKRSKPKATDVWELYRRDVWQIGYSLHDVVEDLAGGVPDFHWSDWEIELLAEIDRLELADEFAEMLATRHYVEFSGSEDHE